MNDSWFFDKNFNGVPEDFFDALKGFDSPLEDAEPKDGEEDWQAQLEHLEPPSSNVLAGFSCSSFGENSIEKSSSVSHESSSQLKQWQSTAEASSGRSARNYDSSEGKCSGLLQISCPVSLLESSSSSCSPENLTLCYSPIPMKRPRSKHPRPRRHTFPLISCSFAFKKFDPLAASESEPESYILDKMLNSAKRSQKRKNLWLLSSAEIEKYSSQQPGDTRKCTHCQVTKTPQWREGPMGPKTLCNACGVRYRSGRLLPEYRPAASPTFVPSLHSNSHRKILEMRKKTKDAGTMAGIDKSVPMASGYLF